MFLVGYTFSGSYDKEFHVGAGRIRDQECVQEFMDIDTLLIQADGDELEVIKSQFSNIPITNNRVVRWQGDAARFIFDNLKL